MPVLTSTDAATVYLADFERFERTRPAGEPAALRRVRRQAIERFAELGFPTPRQEQWRFTDVAPIARTPFERASGPARTESLREQLAGTAGLGDLAGDSYAATLVFVDGRFSPELSAYRELPAGAVVTNLAAALAEHPEKVEPWLTRHAAFAAHPFVALNTAFFEDGAFVYLPRGVVLARPVQFLYLASGGTAGGAATVAYPRNLFVAGESSAATLVEAYRGPEEAVYWNCAVTELVAGPNSALDHYKLQREGRAAFHLATFELHAERSAVVSSHSISLGGALVRNDVNALLAGEGIDAILNGLYMAGGRQLVDNHMRVEHAAPHCGSHELYKGVLEGRSRAVFNGLIHVRPGAQKTDAKQSNRNLLLSREAVANSNPQLEIFADDVKCTHGSTVGQLDEDAIFYLRSRGIGAEAARSLLTFAFASDIVERVKVEPLRHELEEYLFASLPKGEVVRQAV